MKKYIAAAVVFSICYQFPGFVADASGFPVSRQSLTPSRAPTSLPPSSRGGQSFNFSRINIRHQKQETLLCLPTSASMMLSHVGFNYPPRQIKLATLGKPYYGPTAPFSDYTPMSIRVLLDGLKRLGISSWFSKHYLNNQYNTGLEDIKTSIKTGKPVLIIITAGTSRKYGHAVVASGFDDRNQRIFLIDPELPSPGFRMVSYIQFKNVLWNNTYGGLTSRSAIFMNLPARTAATMRRSLTNNITSTSVEDNIEF